MAAMGGYDISTSEEDILDAVFPLLKLLSLTLIGVLLAHPKTQIIPKETFKLLSKLVFALFLPCLIFTHLGQSITLENLLSWWFIPVNVVISMLVGCILGVLVVVICRPPPEYKRFTIIMTAFGNTGNLPLAIVGTVCHNKDNPFGPDCHNKGVSYVSFAQWVSVILVYTLIYHMMEPPMEYYELVEEGSEMEEKTEDRQISRPLLVEAEWPGVEDQETEHSKTPFTSRIFKNSPNGPQTTSPAADLEAVAEESENSPKHMGCMAAPRVVERIKIIAEQTPLKRILQPPTIASLLAIIVGMVPLLKSFVFGNDAPLSFVTDSLQIMAGAMVPSVMLILGGMFAEGPNESKLGSRTTIGIIVARLFVLPLLGFGIISLANKLHLVVHGDQMYHFVLLLQYMMPSAILLGAIARLRGYAVSESSALLFWQHLCALFSLSLYLVIYFRLF